MTAEKSWLLNRVTTKSLVQFATLLGIAVLAPFFHSQIITGSLVNATLFIAAATLGLEGAILVGLLPSLFALSAGTLPLALAPLIPFIILSNILLVLVFSSLKSVNYWWSMLSAAFLKFIFLGAVSTWAINLLFTGGLAGAAATMLSWPQLISALVGGVLAGLVLRSRYFNSQVKED